MSEDPQFARNITAILAFALGVGIGGFCADIVLNPQSEQTAAYTARVDYYGAMVSNGADKCPGPLPKGAAFVDVR